MSGHAYAQLKGLTDPQASAGGVGLGAAYYYEYMPCERLETDMSLMAAAGFSIIRVGESVWSTWEPSDGVFNLDWLEPVLDAAQAHEISVIVGTPTYARPPWMHRMYPQTTAERRAGEPIAYGHRQDANIADRTYLRLVERVVRRIVSRYADHPGVVGWQVDNEPGNELLHNDAVFEGFVESLKTEFGDVEKINNAWGLAFWSHRISRWDELWTPEGNTVPAYDLAWRRYQASITADFIRWQVEIVRELCGSDQFVTTCLALNRPAQDAVKLAKALDVTAVNLYFGTQDALRFPAVAGAGAVHPGFLAYEGLSSIYYQADAARGVQQGGFLVTETVAGSIGEPWTNYPAYDGQLRQAAWAMIARGARMIEYWHWHTVHSGAEAYWGGVLGHSLTPGRTYLEIAQLGADLNLAGEHIAGLVPDVNVAILVSTESSWALAFQPPLSMPGTSSPDRRSYDRIVSAFYNGMFNAGLQCAIVDPHQLGVDVDEAVRRWPILLVPAYYVADDERIEFLDRYARAGGHLVIGPRSFYADRSGQPRAAIMPAGIGASAGISYLESTNLAEPVTVTDVGDSGLTGRATGWADGFTIDGAEALATYSHPHLGRWPAITTRTVELGRVTCVGTIPDRELGGALGRWLRQTSLSTDVWAERPASVTVTSALAGDGVRLVFLSNWSWESCGLTVPMAAHDLLRGEGLPAGSTLALGAWDVRVLRSAGGDR